MTFHVNQSGVWKQVNKVWIKQASIWKPVRELWVNQLGTWKKSYQDTYEITQAASEQNVYLRDKAISAGWNGSDPVRLIYTINPNVWVSSPSNGSWALNIQGFPAGSEVTVINNGYIAGRGGAGGAGGHWSAAGSAGGAGGNALLLNNSGAYTQTIFNNGYIWGGGGGGGGGGGSRAYQYSAVLQGDCRVGGGGGGGGYGAIGEIAGPGAAVFNYESYTQAQIYETRQRNVSSGSGNVGGTGANVARANQNNNPPYGEQTFAEATGGNGGNGGGYGGYGSNGSSGSSYVQYPGTAGSFNAPQGGGAGGNPGFAVYYRNYGSWPSGYGDQRGLIQG